MDKDCKIIFRKAANFLKKNAGVEVPIYIRRIKMASDLDGLCEFKDGYFLIKIDRELEMAHSIDVLLHEIAHVMSWDKNADCHGANWGLAYSKIYRKFLDEFINKQNEIFRKY